MSEDLWRAGENFTVLMNEYHHTNSFKPLTKLTIVETSTRMRRGTAQRPSTMMTGQPSTHTKQTPKSDDIDEDKHQGLIVTKNSTYDDDRTTLPMQCIIGACS